MPLWKETPILHRVNPCGSSLMARAAAAYSSGREFVTGTGAPVR